MLHLARKAFYPSKPPFPLLHVDTTWKFKEMYEFRDTVARDPRGGTRGVPEPRMSGARDQPVHPRLGRPYPHVEDGGPQEGLWTSTASTWPSEGPARRGEIPGQRAGVLGSLGPAPVGSQSSSDQSCGGFQRAAEPGESIRVFPLSNWTELDIWQYIRLEEIPIVPLYFAGNARDRARRQPDHGRRRSDAARAGPGAGREDGAIPYTRVLSTDRGHREQGRHAVRDHSGDVADHAPDAPSASS